MHPFGDQGHGGSSIPVFGAVGAARGRLAHVFMCPVKHYCLYHQLINIIG